MGKLKKKRKRIAIANRGANFANQIHCFSLFYHTRAQSVQRTIKMFSSPNLSFDGNKKNYVSYSRETIWGTEKDENLRCLFPKIPCFALKLSKLGTKSVQLVLQHCCKTRWIIIAMSRVLPATYEPVFQLYIRVARFLSWSLKRAISLFISFCSIVCCKTSCTFLL